MYTPQHHGGISAPSSTVKKVPLNGLFKDGMWHCNCNPRLPATHFQVKKEGKNKGKWFYTCQESKENGCGFFLWDENAAGREMRAVMSNARSEPEPSKSGADGIRYKGLNTTWIENLGKADKLEDAMVTEEYGRETIPGQPETPQKVAKTNPYMTPSTKRKRDNDSLLTPITARKDDFLSVPSVSRRYGSKSNDNEPFGRRNSAQTPTPKRFHDTEVAEAYDDTAQSYDTTDEVLNILKDQHIDEETASRLRALLNKHALRVSGIVKGRDISRVALKAKDAKIAELQQKITTLETEMEMDKTISGHFKRDMAQSIASKRGRGRGRV